MIARALCLLLSALLVTSVMGQTQTPGASSPAPAPSAETPAPEETPLPEPSDQELRQLAMGLGAEAFEIRERSQAALSKYVGLYPKKVREVLGVTYVKNLDPEIRNRLGEVIYDAVVDQMEHNGFLGIQMNTSQTALENRRFVSSIVVIEVLPNTAAHKAGLLPGDQIIQVDDMTFKTLPPAQARVVGREHPNLKQFKEYISGKKEGQPVNLKVRRSNKTLNMSLNLGRRARQYMETPELEKEDRFFENWLRDLTRSQKSEEAEE